MKKLLFTILFFYNTVFAQNKCDTIQLPIIFVHGFLASGDTWASQVQRFSTNGFCENRLFVFDWNTINRSQNTDSLLDVFISNVIKKTSASRVNLVAHSAGTGLCYGYLKDSMHAMKVEHYVNISGAKMKTTAGASANIANMNIYSEDDKVVKGGDIPGAENIRLKGMDHLQSASCEETFSNMFSFFTSGKQKGITVIEPSKTDHISIGGKAVVLGDNRPLADSFSVYLFDPKTGKRYFNKKNKPTGAYTNWTKFMNDGSWGLDVKKDSYLEFEVHPKNGRRLYYFFEPSVRNNQNMYIRALPQSGMIASMLGAIPGDDIQTALVIFSSGQAVIAGRDSLSIDSIPLSVPALAPAGKTAIAFFVFDDGDSITSATALKQYKAAPFLCGADVFIKADEKSTMRVYYNGRSIVLPKRKSKDGIMIAVFN